VTILLSVSVEHSVMSRDVQVRVVFCDWLAWLLHMKRPEHDVSLESVHQTCQITNDLVTFNNTEDASSIRGTHLACNDNEVRSH